MKQNLKFMSFFILFSGGIPMIAVYFGPVLQQMIRVAGQLLV